MKVTFNLAKLYTTSLSNLTDFKLLDWLNFWRFSVARESDNLVWVTKFLFICKKKYQMQTRPQSIDMDNG